VAEPEDALQQSPDVYEPRSPSAPPTTAPRTLTAALKTTGVFPVLLGTFTATILALRIVWRVDQTIFLWPVSATAIALALPYFQATWSRRALLQAAAAIGFLTGATLAGMPWWLSSKLAFILCLDLWLGRLLLGNHVPQFDDLKRQSNILRFLALMVVVPIIDGLLGAVPVSRSMLQPLPETILHSIFTNALGVAVVLPAVLLLRSKYQRGFRALAPPHSLKATAAAVLFVIVSGLIFWQNTGPFLFIVFPPMVLLLLTMGLEGAVFSSVTLSAVGCIATAHGHGPILLMRGTPLEHLLALQALVLVCLITALPIGALIDEHRRGEQIMAEVLSYQAQSLDENRRLTQQIESSRYLFESFLHQSPTLTYIKDDQGRFVFYNREVEKFFAITGTEWLGRTTAEVRPPTEAERYRAQDQQVLESGSQAEFIDEIEDSNGDIRKLRSTKFAYQDIDGRTMLAKISQDITAQLKQQEALAAANRQLELLAMTDALTGLANRRAFESRAAIEYSVALRKQRPLSILTMDIDNFKLRNDTYGHAAGDEALKVLGAVLKSCVRSGDVAARLGGEEFAFLLPETGEEGAMGLAARIQSLLHQAAHGPIELTVSVGVSTTDPTTRNWQRLLARADDAMYEAKRAGKNRALHHRAHLLNLMHPNPQPLAPH
jgi:diguanylate cyclase (GGDEF)-like protein/PAS domain S-box-containing protein